MNIPRRPCDLVSIERNTGYAKQWLDAMYDRVVMMDEDRDKHVRRAVAECQYCYVPYRANRIGGCAMTEAECGLCGTLLQFGNTCVDVLCLDCAKANQLCKHCGGDVDMKRRRRTGQPKACKKGGE